MSEVVDNVSEQQNSAPLKEEEAQPSETVKETTNSVEVVAEAVPAADVAVSSATTEDAAEDSSSTSPKVDNKKTPVKRTPSKRMSFIERAQKESEELVKNMGGSLEIEGGRRTRSSTRGTPTRSTAVSTPPPAKKARTSPASGASTPTRARGRGRKIDTTADGATEEETTPADSKKKTPVKGKKSATKETIEDEELEEIQDDAKEIGKKPDDNDDDVEESKVSDDKVDLSESNADAIQHKDVNSLETVAESKEVLGDTDTKEKVKKNEEYEAEDKTDTALKSVAEETQSQVAEESIPTEKSNDALEKMEDDDASEDVVEVPSPALKAGVGKDVENQRGESKVQVSSVNVSELNNIEKVGDSIQQINSVEPVVVVANNSIDAKLLAEPAATNVAIANNKEGTNTPAANDSNKTENDLCEPKIATSPQISAANDNSTVTTPQTCN